MIETEAASFSGLGEAIAATVAGSIALSDRMLETLAEVERDIRPMLDELDVRMTDSGWSVDGLPATLDRARDEIRATRMQLEARREGLQRFRIAMFGRTGTGKSSLIEALTRGDAATVSPGQGDHTEDVREVDWGPTLVVDMPGTLGAGRRLSREQLEERTEAEVQLADLVILAFDSQNQQVSEFQRAAEMVIRFRKPVIVVLNVRNPRWRSPDPSTPARVRARRDGDVAQHIDHLSYELARIGVHDCPTVAINTMRATFARCDPYRADFIETRNREVAAYGRALLLESSNLPALETLIVRLVSSSCADLRTASLVGDLAARLARLEELLAKDTERIPGIETGLERLLTIVGYPRARRPDAQALDEPPMPTESLIGGNERSAFERQALSKMTDASRWATDGILLDAFETTSGNELSFLEELRGQPFGAPRTGGAHQLLEQRLLVALRAERIQAWRRAEDRVIASRAKSEVVDFGREVLQRDRLQEVAGDAIEHALQDAFQLIDRTGETVRLGFAIDDARLTVEQGGRGSRALATISRAGSVTASGALAVAATNFWNPGGWTAAGVAVAGIFTSFLGSKLSKRSERKRLDKRAETIAQGRRMVDSAFDKLEGDARQVYWAALTSVTADAALRPLRDAADLRLVSAAAAAAGHSGLVEITPVPLRYSEASNGRALAGRGWAPPGVEVPRPVDLPAVESGEFGPLRWRPVEVGALEGLDLQRLEQLPTTMKQWLGRGVAGPLSARMRSVRAARPRIVLCGDYSAGKSSLMARLTRKTREGRRRIKRSADPTTRSIESGFLGPYRVVDTPGLGSSRASDALVASRALESASLVLYLVTPRLIADLPSVLIDQLSAPDLRGDLARARTRFALTRIDEMGASPLEAPQEFVRLVNRKREELATILQRRGIPIAPGEILALAPDPFASDFDEAVLGSADGWSGVETLRGELLSTPVSMLDRARDAAGLTAACGELHLAIEDWAAAGERASADAGSLRSLGAATRRAERSAIELKDALRAQLIADVTEVARELVDRVLHASGDEHAAAVERAQKWADDPRIIRAIEVWQRHASDQIEELVATITEELDRRFSALFELQPSAAPSIVGKSSPGGGPAHRAAAQGAKAASGMRTLDATKVLKLRDGLMKLRLPKCKFKPWGAGKLANKLKVAGRVAAVAGLALELAAIAHDEHTKKKREELRRRVHRDLHADLARWVEAVMSGTRDAPGASGVLDGIATELAEIVGDLDADAHAAEATATTMRERVERAEQFLRQRTQ